MEIMRVGIRIGVYVFLYFCIKVYSLYVGCEVFCLNWFVVEEKDCGWMGCGEWGDGDGWFLCVVDG